MGSRLPKWLCVYMCIHLSVCMYQYTYPDIHNKYVKYLNSKKTNPQDRPLTTTKSTPSPTQKDTIQPTDTVTCLNQARSRDSVFSRTRCQPSHDSRGLLHWSMEQKMAVRGGERWPSSRPAKPGLLSPNEKPPFRPRPAPSLMLYYALWENLSECTSGVPVVALISPGL